MSARTTIEAFEAWRRDEQPIVMVTVTRTEGSTYSKAGHRILIGADGECRGLVSGGCLEGDLAERARNVITTGRPCSVTYDLRDDADELWGMGIGCNGVIEVILQRLDAPSAYEPFATIADCALARRDAVCSVVAAGDDNVPVGATVVDWGDGRLEFGLGRETGEAGRDTVRKDGNPRLVAHAGLKILHAAVRPIPRLLVIGAGPDAVPVVRMASELGWRVTIADHRDSYVNNAAFAAAERQCVAAPADHGAIGDPDAFDAAVVMTHHLDSDRGWLTMLAATHIGYIGLLGPPARRERLVAESGTEVALGERLHGPVGIPIGANSAESIALSMLAEIQSVIGPA